MCAVARPFGNSRPSYGINDFGEKRLYEQHM